jgi:uncharacterized protein (DUF1697 family)
LSDYFVTFLIKVKQTNNPYYMHKYLALLRGINVSGQKKIKMADLKELLEKEGLKDVKTYIQSGNVVFVHEGDQKQDLAERISNLIEKTYSFRVETLVLTTEDLKKYILNNPFDKDSLKDNGRKYFTFLMKTPEPDRIELLNEISFLPEEFELYKEVIYLYMPNGYGVSKLDNNFFEKKLRIPATTRNYRTVYTLLEWMEE